MSIMTAADFDEWCAPRGLTWRNGLPGEIITGPRADILTEDLRGRMAVVLMLTVETTTPPR